MSLDYNCAGGGLRKTPENYISEFLFITNYVTAFYTDTNGTWPFNVSTVLFICIYSSVDARRNKLQYNIYTRQSKKVNSLFWTREFTQNTASVLHGLSHRPQPGHFHTAPLTCSQSKTPFGVLVSGDSRQVERFQHVLTQRC